MNDKINYNLNGKIRYKIKRLEKTFIRDRWGSLTNCYWNEMIKEDILKLEAQINYPKDDEKKLPMNEEDGNVVVICDKCKNSVNGIKCLVKHKFKEDGKTQSEFIKILGGSLQKCDYFL